MPSKRACLRLGVSINATLLLLSLVPSRVDFARAQSTPDSEVRAVVEKFFSAIQRKDLVGLLALWSKGSPQLAGARQVFQGTFSDANAPGLKNFTVDRIELTGDRATVRVVTENESAGKAASAGEPSEKIHRSLELVRDHESWEVWSYASDEERLAAAIATTGADNEPQRLIAQDGSLINPRLIKAMAYEGGKLVEKGNYSQALRVYELAMKFAKQLSDIPGQAEICINLAYLEYRRENIEEALAHCQEGLRLYRQSGDKPGIGRALAGLGAIYILRDPDQALHYLQESLEIAKEIGDKRGTARAFSTIANLQYQQGRFMEASGNYEESIRVYKEIGETQPLAIAESNLGSNFRERGDTVGALEHHVKALDIKEAINDRPGEAQTLDEIGVDQRYLGNYSAALRSFQRSLAIEEELDEKPGMARALNNLGAVHEMLGNYGEAMDCFNRSLRLADGLADKLIEANALMGTAELRSANGDLKGARQFLERSLEISKRFGSVANVLDKLAGLEVRSGNNKQAMSYLQESLAMREAEDKREPGDRRFIAACLIEIAELYNSDGAYPKAVEAASRAASISEQMRDPEDLHRALTAEGNAYRRLNRLREAREAFARAITVVEQLRADAPVATVDKQRFMETRTGPYYALTALFIDQDNCIEALDMAERSKARALIDIMESGRPSLTRSMTAGESVRERDINSEMVSLNAQILKERVRKEPDQRRLSDLSNRLEKVRLERDAFQTALYSSHPELKTQRARYEPISLGECAGLLRNENEVLLEFVVSEEETYVFVITKKDSAAAKPDLKVHKIDIKSKELGGLCERFRERLAHHVLDGRPSSNKLYDLLLGPAAAEIRGKSNLVIVPDGPLWDLPFQALQSRPGRYLVEDYAVSYAPSLTALREMSKPRSAPARPSRAPTTLLAFGNPALGKQASQQIKSIFMDADLAPLPQAETQVEELGKLYGADQSRVYVGAQATKGRLENEAPGARILHIAAHGIVNNVSPMYSQIVLSTGPEGKDDAVLEAWEIMEMDLGADLAVLAACDSGRGRYGRGEGMIGLSWAFFVAGCPTTVASQWSIDAESTTELMVEFHRNLRAGLSKAEALRRAEIKMLKGDARYRHPFYWAPFAVIGNGG